MRIIAAHGKLTSPGSVGRDRLALVMESSSEPGEIYLAARALKDRGKTVELVFHPREGHGFSENYHQLDRLERQHEWTARCTLGGEARKTTAP
jgi:dipeptidyl aminopeptidase/acylaminoacyl peptidase